jgi:hypothetical protein
MADIPPIHKQQPCAGHASKLIEAAFTVALVSLESLKPGILGRGEGLPIHVAKLFHGAGRPRWNQESRPIATRLGLRRERLLAAGQAGSNRTGVITTAPPLSLGRSVGLAGLDHVFVAVEIGATSRH